MSPSSSKTELLTGARQTMQSWIKVIREADEIPAAYRERVHDLLDGRDFPYMVFAPPVSGAHFPLSEKLLFWQDTKLHVLERGVDQINLTVFPREQIEMIECGSILLYSWLSIFGKTAEGEERTETIVYNTSTLRHIQPFVDQIRSLPAQSARMKQRAFDELEKENFKFANFARKSLKDDEKVLAYLWQPEVSRSFFSVFKRFFSRPIFLSHLSIVTELELIFIAEDHRSPQVKGKRYGGIWRYVPLQNLRSVSVLPESESLSSLYFESKSGRRITHTYTLDGEEQALAFKAALEKRLGSL